MNTVGERIAEDWACGRLTGTVAEAIDAACAKAKAFAVKAAGWQPIETAPRDGTEFLAFGSYFYPGDKDATVYCSIVSRNGEFWNDWEGDHPDGFFSHWTPLPSPPKINHIEVGQSHE